MTINKLCGSDCGQFSCCPVNHARRCRGSTGRWNRKHDQCSYILSKARNVIVWDMVRYR
jgi:hypothetical protein